MYRRIAGDRAIHFIEIKNSILRGAIKIISMWISHIHSPYIDIKYSYRDKYKIYEGIIFRITTINGLPRWHK